MEKALLKEKTSIANLLSPYSKISNGYEKHIPHLGKRISNYKKG